MAFDIIEELVTANRILANGTSSTRSATSASVTRNRYLLSRARAPERIETANVMEFTLEGDPVDARDRKPYLERFTARSTRRGPTSCRWYIDA